VRNFDRSQLSDSALLTASEQHDSDEYAAIAEHLADLGEIEARKLYAAAGYPTMVAWCMAKRNMREQKARKRVRIAQSARQHPALLHAIADGRLHLSAALLLLPWLSEENVDDLIRLSAHRSLTEVESLLREWTGRRNVSITLESPASSDDSGNMLSARTATTSDTPAESAEAPLTMTPPAPKPITLLVTVDEDGQTKLRLLRALLGHAVPSGEINQIFDWMMDLSIRHLEKRKYGATDRPRRSAKPVDPESRYIPAEVRRAVRERDADQCTFVSDDGHRCECRTRLEFDHIVPYAQGGGRTIDNIRLRCRTHNQYEAERMYGVEFMKNKREQAAKRARTETAEVDPDRDIVPWLRSLRFSAAEAKTGAKACAHIPGAPLEARMRVALQRLTRVRPRAAVNGVAV
jgi:5-methylcytosine-specific restriction endonuclease McrA